eukprot:5606404-Alexandrium_andersonii.AAC.1
MASPSPNAHQPGKESHTLFPAHGPKAHELTNRVIPAGKMASPREATAKAHMGPRGDAIVAIGGLNEQGA